MGLFLFVLCQFSLFDVPVTHCVVSTQFGKNVRLNFFLSDQHRFGVLFFIQVPLQTIKKRAQFNKNGLISYTYYIQIWSLLAVTLTDQD